MAGDQVKVSLEQRQSLPVYGRGGQHPRKLREQADATGRPQSVNESSWRLGGKLTSDWCRKEKVTGFTQGGLCLASLFAFWWGRGGAGIVFQLDISKAFNIIPHNLCPGSDLMVCMGG